MAPAYQRRCGVQVRVARRQNRYGAEGTWRGGHEKAPAAICRKGAGKKITVGHIDGPVGVRSRNFSNARTYSLGWRPKV